MSRFLAIIFICTSFNALASEALKCSAPKALHSKVKTFFVGDINGHAQAQSYLLNLDARQEDPSYQNGELTVLSLHNGCDNYFEVSFNSEALRLILDKKTTSITGSFKYNYPASVEEYNETGADYSVGEVEINCELSVLP